MELKKVVFLHEVDINLLLELNEETLREKLNIRYRKNFNNLGGRDLIDMQWFIRSVSEERQTIMLRIVGYAEESWLKKGLL